MTGRLTKWFDAAAFRRWVAAVCVLALLALSHLHPEIRSTVEAGTQSALTQSMSLLPDGANDHSGTVSDATHHCHGCTIAVLPLMALAAADPIPAVPFPGVRTGMPLLPFDFDNPPPICLV